MSEAWPNRNIQARMALIRRDADEAVDEIAVQAREVTQLADWRYHVRRYPWIAAAGAAAAGYLIVPKRTPRIVHPDPDTLAALSREGRLTIRQKPTLLQTLTSGVLSLLSNVVMRSAASYLADTLSAPSASSPSSESRES